MMVIFALFGASCYCFAGLFHRVQTCHQLCIYVYIIVVDIIVLILYQLIEIIAKKICYRFKVILICRSVKQKRGAIAYYDR